MGVSVYMGRGKVPNTTTDPVQYLGTVSNRLLGILRVLNRRPTFCRGTQGIVERGGSLTHQ